MLASFSLSRAIRLLLFALLFMPFVYGHSFVFPLVIPRIFVFQAVVGILAALWAVWIIRERVAITWTPVRIAVLAWFAFLVVGSIFGVDGARSLWSTQERGLGIIGFAHFVLLFFILSTFREQLPRERYVAVSVGVSFVAALFAFIQLLFPQTFLEQEVGRPGSFLGNPAFFSAYLLFHVFFALWLAFESFSRRSFFWSALFLVVSAFEVVVVFVTQTRGALVGLGAGALVFLVACAAWGSTFRLAPRITLRRASFFVLGILFLCGAVFFATREAPIWQRVPGLNRLTKLSLDTPDIQPRLLALQVVREAWRDRPLLGYGFENFKYAFDRHYKPQFLRYGFTETYFDKPHNALAEMLVVGGVLGFIAYLALWFFVIRAMAFRSSAPFFRPFGLAIAASYLVQNLFIFDTFGSYLMLFVFFAFVDSGISRAAPMEPPRTTPVLSGSRRFFAGRGGVVFMVSLALAWAAANGVFLFANNRHYWGLNYFLNRKSDLAAQSFERALALLHPYRSSVARDFASSLSQIYLQNVPVPDLEGVVRRSLDHLSREIEGKPQEYFLRLTWADVATTFAFLDRSMLDKAERYLAEAFVLSPERQQLYYTLGKIRLLRGDPEGALGALRSAVELDPQVGDPHFYYGLLAFEAGWPDLGLAELGEARRLGREPKSAREMVVAANYYGDAGRHDDARKLYRDALALDPENLETRLKYGIVSYFSGDIATAKREIERVAEGTDLTASPSYSDLKPIFDALGISLPR